MPEKEVGFKQVKTIIEDIIGENWKVALRMMMQDEKLIGMGLMLE